MALKNLCEDVALEFGESRLRGALEHDSGLLVLRDGSFEVLSVNLLGAIHLPWPDEVFVRDYSEHSGLPAALARTGRFEQVEAVRVGPLGPAQRDCASRRRKAHGHGAELGNIASADAPAPRGSLVFVRL